MAKKTPNRDDPYFNGPATDAVSVTPSDSTEYDPPLRSLYITAAGNISVRTVAQTTITIAVPANFLLPLAVDKVNATNTTSTGIIGLK